MARYWGEQSVGLVTTNSTEVEPLGKNGFAEKDYPDPDQNDVREP